MKTECVKNYFETYNGSIIPFNRVLYTMPIISDKYTSLLIIVSGDIRFACEPSQLENYKRWLNL